MIAFDLHCHSHFSDGMASIPEIEEHCLKAGLGVALTDHNEIRGALQLFDRERVPLILATEIGTREGFEFLAYFRGPADIENYYRSIIEPNLLKRYMVRSRIATEAVLDSIPHFDAFFSLAHPYALGRKSIRHFKHAPGLVRRILDETNALELYNGALPQRWNAQAEQLQQKFKKKFTVGSDAHRLKELGSVRVELRAKVGSAASTCFEHLRHNRFGDWSAIRKRSSARSVGSLAYKHIAFYITSGDSSARPRPRLPRSSRRADRQPPEETA